MNLDIPTTFPQWFDWYRRSQPQSILQNMNGSCMLPKVKLEQMLKDAYEAGVAMARTAASVPSPN